MLAVPADRLPEALGELDPGNRALLDLSLRRGVSDAEIGGLLRKDPEDVARGRDAVLELLADALDVAGHDRRERVRQAVAALPDDAWHTPRPAPSRPPRVPAASAPPAPPPDTAPREPKPAPDRASDREAARAARARDEEPYFEPETARSRRGGLIAVLAVLAVLGVLLALILSAGDDEGSNESGSQPAPQPGDTPATPAPQGQSAPLEPLIGGRGEGRVAVTDEGAKITLRGLPNPDGTYQVWLYDSIVRAKSLGTIAEGSGRLDVQLPPDVRRYRFLDVSREPDDANPNHSGISVLRAPLRDVSNG